MAHCTQLCTTKKKFYSQQIKKFFLGITLFNKFSSLFQKEKNLMPLFLIACNRGLIIYPIFLLVYRHLLKMLVLIQNEDLNALKNTGTVNHTLSDIMSVYMAI